MKQHNSKIHVILDKDPAFGPNTPGHRNKTLTMLLMSPTKKLQSHFSIIHLSRLSWRTSIIDYAFLILGLILKDYDTTLLYCPSPPEALMRPWQEQLT